MTGRLESQPSTSHKLMRLLFAQAHACGSDQKPIGKKQRSVRKGLKVKVGRASSWSAPDRE